MVRQAMSLKDKWGASHPYDWLVWEPGAWKVPASGQGLAETQHAPSGQFDRPPQGDCLCFELRPAPDSKIKIGRAPENGIVINDATVSREHVLLERSPEKQWLASAQRPLQLAGKPIEPGKSSPLKSGDRLVLGGVTLTYLSQAGFWERIRTEAQKLVG